MTGCNLLYLTMKTESGSNHPRDNITFDIAEVVSVPEPVPVSEQATASVPDPATVPEGTARIQSQQKTFAEYEETIKAYIAEHKPNLAILTPAYGSQVYVNYTHSLINTVNLCNLVGLPVRIEFCRNDSLVSRARNNLVAKALLDKDTTHVMFIDADISWSPVDMLNMLMSDKDVVGGAYPVKSREWDRLMLEGGGCDKEVGRGQERFGPERPHFGYRNSQAEAVAIQRESIVQRDHDKRKSDGGAPHRDGVYDDQARRVRADARQMPRAEVYRQHGVFDEGGERVCVRAV